MNKILFAVLLLLSAAGCSPTAEISATDPCSTHSNRNFADTLSCYRRTVEIQPPEYMMTAMVRLPGVEQRTYQLNSQTWSPERLVQPAAWQHQVTVTIPDNARRVRALVIVNNGTRHAKFGAAPIAATDFSPDALATIARNTRTVVVSINDVPSQYLVYADDSRPRAEDDSVAHSWALFMTAPQDLRTIPLHVPMAISISRAMTLAERELSALQITRFVVSGISKRAWVSWLAGVNDSRIDAVVPFAMDLLDTRETLQHMYRSYGGNWPIAFQPYYAQRIDTKIGTAEFAWLMQIEDPLNYLDTRHAARLEIPKYVVNASGDDFFVPDNAKYYFDRLPGTKVLRVVPNSSHNGIRASSIDSLSRFVNRIQEQTPLPGIESSIKVTGLDATLSFRSTEQPEKLVLWSATNSKARDFRYACGVRYSATATKVVLTQNIVLPVPQTGWSASFVEATYADGFIATSQVYILGKRDYPAEAPPALGGACKTLPGRGFAE